jgi:hypothetical protein
MGVARNPDLRFGTGIPGIPGTRFPITLKDRFSVDRHELVIGNSSPQFPKLLVFYSGRSEIRY